MKQERIMKPLYMAKIMVLVCLSVLVIYPLSLAYAKKPAKSVSRETEEFNFAGGLFSRGMYDMAREEYGKFIKQYPESVYLREAFYRMIECLFMENRYKEALKKADTFPGGRSDGLSISVELIRGRIYLAQKNYKKAVTVFNTIMNRTYVRDVTEAAWYYCASAQYSEGDTGKCLDTLEGLLSRFHKGDYLTMAELKTGDIYLARGGYNKAAERYVKAALETTVPELKREAYFRAAGAYYKTGDYANAAGFYKRVMELDPGRGLLDKAALGLVSSLYGARFYKEAIDESAKLSQGITSLPIKAEILYLTGNAYFQIGDFDASERTFSEISEKYPKTEYGRKARLNKCWSYYEKKDFEKCLGAIEAYITSVKNPSGEALYLKARTLNALGKEEEALKEYGKIIDAGKGSGFFKDSLYDAAWISAVSGDNAGSAGYYASFYHNYPDDERTPDVLLRLGQQYLKMKKTDEAIGAYLDFISKFPQNDLMGKVLMQLGTAYFEKGKYDEAIETFRKFLSNFPDSPEKYTAYYAIADSYQKKGLWDKASDELDNILKVPGNAFYDKALESEAYCCFQKGDMDKAASMYAKLINERSGYILPVGVYKWLADFYLKRKGYKDSIKILKAMTDRYPDKKDDGETLYMMGEDQRSLKNWKEAMKYFDKAVSLKVGPPYRERAYLGLGKIYTRTGDLEKALICFNHALEDYRENMTGARARFGIGVVNFKMKDYDEAARQFMMVAILYKDKDLCPEALLEAGISFDKADKADKALEAFRELIKQYPESHQVEKAKKEIRRIEVENR